MGAQPRIVVDLDERKCVVPSALRALGAELEHVRLAAGDYVVGHGALVERKSMPDLHDSVLRGRFWPQLGKLRAAARYPYLVVEGDVDDGPLRGNAIRGVLLATLEQRIRLLRTADQEDTAAWLYRLAVRCQRRDDGSSDRPAYAQRRRPPREDPAEAMLSSIPGISVRRARALLERFGSVAGVAAADRRGWQRVPGIGPANAVALERALTGRGDPGIEAAARGQVRSRGSGVGVRGR